MGYLISVFQTVCALMSTLALLVYDFITLCGVIGKMELIEKAFNKFFPKYEYNEILVFQILRRMLLWTAMPFHLMAYNVYNTLTIWGDFHMILLYVATALSFVNLIKS